MQCSVMVKELGLYLRGCRFDSQVGRCHCTHK
uniref:Uncharacterized protein n=1 Tax=Anguilla anguilla TaxID=7936 RepID=A0A0E9VPV2_ANGAN